MELALKLISGICWTIVYIEIIRLGFKHKTYGMPAAALFLNIGWEMVHSRYILTNPANVQNIINVIWFLFDLVILVTYFRYGRRHFPKNVDERLFIPWSILLLVTCVVFECLAVVEFGNLMGAVYSAFPQNLIMSILFVDMFARRGSSLGQSPVIAINKFLGTLAPTILFWIKLHSWFVLYFGVGCAVFDLLYIGLLFSKMNKKTV